MSDGLHYQPTVAERYPLPMLSAVLEGVLVFIAAWLAYGWRFADWSLSSAYVAASMVLALAVVTCLWAFGLFGSWRGKSFLKMLRGLCFGWLVAIGMVLSVAVLLKVAEDYSRQWFIATVLIGSGLGLLARMLVFFGLRKFRSSGRNLKTVLLVDTGGRVASRLSDRRSLDEEGFRIADKLTFRSDAGWFDELVERVEGSAVHEVWLCLPLSEGAAIKAIMHSLRHYTVALRFLPEWDDLPLLNHRVSNIAGVYSLDLSCSLMYGSHRLLKRAEDLVVAGLISVLILPLCLGIGLLVKASSPGPVLFKQYRLGANGQKFKVYKFRSMVVHQEQGGEVTQARRSDPRVTRVGAFLRRTSLDELPQFFNVLQGHMSVVGPRPHALAHNEYYKEVVESYMQRHKVKPGITGWAQVNGYRGETDTLEKMQKRVECDLWYIDNWSLWLDIRIIFLTVFKGFVGKSAY